MGAPTFWPMELAWSLLKSYYSSDEDIFDEYCERCGGPKSPLNQGTMCEECRVDDDPEYERYSPV